jgi:hypothetical protein
VVVPVVNQASSKHASEGRLQAPHRNKPSIDQIVKPNTREIFMKTHRTVALILATAALLGLGGCGTLTPQDMLAQFEPGEQSHYVVVPGKPKHLTDIKDFAKYCGQQDLGAIGSSAYNDWMKAHVCNDISKWQLVSGVYHTKVWGSKGLKYAAAYAPSNWNIEENDILEFSLNLSKEGKMLRPDIVKRIARKAKDATKESGCYWDGGKGATTAFIGGGAVCDGWNWRDQKFAKE